MDLAPASWDDRPGVGGMTYAPPMTVLTGRTPCSAVTGLRESRSFVTIWNDDLVAAAHVARGRVVPDRSCTPERLRP